MVGRRAEAAVWIESVFVLHNADACTMQEMPLPLLPQSQRNHAYVSRSGESAASSNVLARFPDRCE
jgi:hypothetical protein